MTAEATKAAIAPRRCSAPEAGVDEMLLALCSIRRSMVITGSFLHSWYNRRAAGYEDSTAWVRRFFRDALVHFSVLRCEKSLEAQVPSLERPGSCDRNAPDADAWTRFEGS